MAVLKSYRDRGIGLALLRELIRIGERHAPGRLCLSAQCYAIPFYEKLGFVAEGPVYDEAGIDHRWMVRRADPV